MSRPRNRREPRSRCCLFGRIPSYRRSSLGPSSKRSSPGQERRPTSSPNTTACRRGRRLTLTDIFNDRAFPTTSRRTVVSLLIPNFPSALRSLSPGYHRSPHTSSRHRLTAASPFANIVAASQRSSGL